jgi:hypothetical protein
MESLKIITIYGAACSPASGKIISEYKHPVLSLGLFFYLLIKKG